MSSNKRSNRGGGGGKPRGGRNADKSRGGGGGGRGGKGVKNYAYEEAAKSFESTIVANVIKDKISKYETIARSKRTDGNFKLLDHDTCIENTTNRVYAFSFMVNNTHVSHPIGFGDVNTKGTMSCPENPNIDFDSAFDTTKLGEQDISALQVASKELADTFISIFQQNHLGTPHDIYQGVDSLEEFTLSEYLKLIGDGASIPKGAGKKKDMCKYYKPSAAALLKLKHRIKSKTESLAIQESLGRLFECYATDADKKSMSQCVERILAKEKAIAERNKKQKNNNARGRGGFNRRGAGTTRGNNTNADDYSSYSSSSSSESEDPANADEAEVPGGSNSAKKHTEEYMREFVSKKVLIDCSRKMESIYHAADSSIRSASSELHDDLGLEEDEDVFFEELDPNNRKNVVDEAISLCEEKIKIVVRRLIPKNVHNKASDQAKRDNDKFRALVEEDCKPEDLNMLDSSICDNSTKTQGFIIYVIVMDPNWSAQDALDCVMKDCFINKIRTDNDDDVNEIDNILESGGPVGNDSIPNNYRTPVGVKDEHHRTHYGSSKLSEALGLKGYVKSRSLFGFEKTMIGNKAMDLNKWNICSKIYANTFDSCLKNDGDDGSSFSNTRRQPVNGSFKSGIDQEYFKDDRYLSRVGYMSPEEVFSVRNAHRYANFMGADIDDGSDLLISEISKKPRQSRQVVVDGDDIDMLADLVFDDTDEPRSDMDLEMDHREHYNRDDTVANTENDYDKAIYSVENLNVKTKTNIRNIDTYINGWLAKFEHKVTDKMITANNNDDDAGDDGNNIKRTKRYELISDSNAIDSSFSNIDVISYKFKCPGEGKDRFYSLNYADFYISNDVDSGSLTEKHFPWMGELMIRFVAEDILRMTESELHNKRSSSENQSQYTYSTEYVDLINQRNSMIRMMSSCRSGTELLSTNGLSINTMIFDDTALLIRKIEELSNDENVKTNVNMDDIVKTVRRLVGIKPSSTDLANTLEFLLTRAKPCLELLRMEKPSIADIMSSDTKQNNNNDDGEMNNCSGVKSTWLADKNSASYRQYLRYSTLSNNFSHRLTAEFQNIVDSQATLTEGVRALIKFQEENMKKFDLRKSRHDYESSTLMNEIERLALAVRFVFGIAHASNYFLTTWFVAVDGFRYTRSLHLSLLNSGPFAASKSHVAKMAIACLIAGYVIYMDNFSERSFDTGKDNSDHLYYADEMPKELANNGDENSSKAITVKKMLTEGFLMLLVFAFIEIPGSGTKERERVKVESNCSASFIFNANKICMPESVLSRLLRLMYAKNFTELSYVVKNMLKTKGMENSRTDNTDSKQHKEAQMCESYVRLYENMMNKIESGKSIKKNVNPNVDHIFIQQQQQQQQEEKTKTSSPPPPTTQIRPIVNRSKKTVSDDVMSINATTPSVSQAIIPNRMTIPKDRSKLTGDQRNAIVKRLQGLEKTKEGDLLMSRRVFPVASVVQTMFTDDMENPQNTPFSTKNNPKEAITHRMQTFHALIGYTLKLIRVGALPEVNMSVGHSITLKFFEILKEKTGIGLTNYRVYERIIIVSLLMSIWGGLSELFGSESSDLGDVVAEKGFEISHLLKIKPYLCCTFENVIFALSSLALEFINPFQSIIVSIVGNKICNYPSKHEILRFNKSMSSRVIQYNSVLGKNATKSFHENTAQLNILAASMGLEPILTDNNLEKLKSFCNIYSWLVKVQKKNCDKYDVLLWMLQMRDSCRDMLTKYDTNTEKEREAKTTGSLSGKKTEKSKDGICYENIPKKTIKYIRILLKRLESFLPDITQHFGTLVKQHANTFGAMRGKTSEGIYFEF